MNTNEQPGTRTPRRAAAFFDFDNTLIHGDSQGLEIEFLFKHRRIGLPTVIPIVAANYLFKRDLISADRMVRTCLRIYRGRHTNQPAAWSANLCRESIRPRLSAAMCTAVQEHHRQGHLAVILSASLRHLIEPVARDLDIRHVCCTDLETDARGAFTGRTKGPVCVGRHKTIQAARLADRLGVDLAASYVYTDHHADRHLLEAVGNPVAVSPTPRLRRYALQKKWTIMTR